MGDDDKYHLREIEVVSCMSRRIEGGGMLGGERRRRVVELIGRCSHPLRSVAASLKELLDQEFDINVKHRELRLRFKEV